MFKIEMFDINDKIKRKEKLKLLETLLIMGGIIGGTNYDKSMGIILGLFIISSLTYFLILTDKRFFKVNEKYKFFTTISVAASFSAIVTGLFTTIEITSISMFFTSLGLIIIIYILLMYLVSRTLYT